MEIVFEVTDKSGRTIHLSNERWKHVNQEHPEVAPHVQDIKDALVHPTKIVPYEEDDKVNYYYRYFKQRQSKYMLVIVKYLNSHGFIITAYFVRNIK